MFIKKSKSHGKLYLSIVQGYRTFEGKTKHKTIKNLGFFDDLIKIYPDPIKHFNDEIKKITDQQVRELTIRNIQTAKITNNPDFKLFGVNPLMNIYNELNLNTFLRNKQKDLNIKYNLNDIFSLLVYGRILFPGSKKSTFENKRKLFSKNDFTEDDMYRSLDYFYQYKDEIETLFWNSTKNLYNRDIEHSFYDCTNYYFEIEYNDDDEYEVDNNGNLKLDNNGKPIISKKGLRKRGPEKNHRPDPIIEMGLLMDSTGIPLAYDLFPGNESEKLSLLPLIKRVKNKFGIGRTIVVADRGLNTSDNIIYLSGTSLDQAKNRDGYVYGQSVRGADDEFKQWVLKGEYNIDIIKNDYDESITFKHKSRIYPKTMYVIREDKGKTKSGNIIREKIIVDQKQMVYYSEKYASKQKHDRDMMVAKAKDLISNPSKYNKSTSYGAAAYVNNIKFSKQTGEVIATDLSINEDRIKEEEKYDGYYSIVTSEENLTDIEIRNIYRGLAKIEETFKVTKSELEARPAYVWTNEHIQSHFLTCFAALVIIRLLEKKLNNKYSVNNIIECLKSMTSTHLQDEYYIQNFEYKYIDLINSLELLFNQTYCKKYISIDELKKILKT